MINLCFDSDGLLAKWGNSFEDTFLPGYFHTGVEPDKTAITTVKYLNDTAKEQETFRVFILSARYDDSESKDGKNRFEEDKKAFYKDNGLGDVPTLFVPCGRSKREALLQNRFGNEDWFLLFDDHTPNLIDWEQGGSKYVGIKWLNGINGSKQSGFEGLCLPADRMNSKALYTMILSLTMLYS